MKTFAKYLAESAGRKDTISLHQVDGRWCITMTGIGDPTQSRPLPERVRAVLDQMRIPWTDDSDDLSLELVNPTPSQVLTAKQHLKMIRDANFKFQPGS